MATFCYETKYNLLAMMHIFQYFFRLSFISFVSFGFILMTSYSSRGQAIQDELVKYAQKKYGTSDMLVNGWKYYPDHFNATGNPYFNQLDWENGSAETTHGRFDELLLRYNVQMQELVLQKVLQNGETAYVMLNPDFINTFTIGDYDFINTDRLDLHSDLQGYFEVIYQGGITYLAKHTKMFVANYTANSPQGSISGQNTQYFLLDGEKLHKVQSRRALLNVFPDKKKEVKRFLKKEKIKFRKAGNRDLYKLMKYLDTLQP